MRVNSGINNETIGQQDPMLSDPERRAEIYALWDKLFLKPADRSAEALGFDELVEMAEKLVGDIYEFELWKDPPLIEIERKGRNAFANANEMMTHYGFGLQRQRDSLVSLLAILDHPEPALRKRRKHKELRLMMYRKRQVRELHKQGLKQKDIARFVGFSQQRVSQVIREARAFAKGRAADDLARAKRNAAIDRARQAYTCRKPAGFRLWWDEQKRLAAAGDEDAQQVAEWFAALEAENHDTMRNVIAYFNGDISERDDTQDPRSWVNPDLPTTAPRFRG